MLLAFLVVMVPVFAFLAISLIVSLEISDFAEGAFILAFAFVVMFTVYIGTGLSMEEYTITRIACEDAGGVINEWTWQCVTPSETIELPE